MSSVMSLLALGLLTVSSTIHALGPIPVPLGTAANYAILAQTGVSTVPPSTITGNIGLSPAAGTFLTGFSLTLDPSGTFSTSGQVTGKLFAASYTSPTPSVLTTAISDVHTAYTNASTRLSPNFLNLNSGLIGGTVLLPGLYKWTGGVSAASNAVISGTASDTWIFQIAGTFSISAGQRIVLAGGALAKNIIWAVADSATFGAGAHLEGVLLGKTAVTLQTGTSVNGRVLAQTLVALQQTTVVAPA